MERRVVVMAVWIGEARHAVVTWVEGAERAIARGRGRVETAVGVVGMAGVVVQSQRSGEAEAKGVSSSVGAGAREAGAVAVTEAGAGVEARRTGVALGVGEVGEVPTSAEAGEVATLRATSAHSTQTQS